jgi:hypothetical protein
VTSCSAEQGTKVSTERAIFIFSIGNKISPEEEEEEEEEGEEEEEEVEEE